MNAKERYDMVERYLDDMMSPEAQREFEQLAGQDGELARELRAEQMIRSAFRNDSVVVPLISSEPSSLITATLAATGTQTVGAASAGVLGTILGTPLGLTILAAAAALGLVAGILFFGPFSHQKGEVDLPRPVPTVIAAPPSGDGSGNGTPSLFPAATTARDATGRMEQGGPEDGAKAKRGMKSSGEDAINAVSETKKSDGANRKDALSRYLQEQEGRKEIQTLRDDSLRLKIDLNKK